APGRERAAAPPAGAREPAAGQLAAGAPAAAGRSSPAAPAAPPPRNGRDRPASAAADAGGLPAPIPDRRGASGGGAFGPPGRRSRGGVEEGELPVIPAAALVLLLAVGRRGLGPTVLVFALPAGFLFALGGLALGELAGGFVGLDAPFLFLALPGGFTVGGELAG